MTVSEIAALIKKYVDYHQNKILPLQIEGQLYYTTKNPHINLRRKEFFSNKYSKPVEDPYKANNKVASSYMKLLVDQKVNYSINNNLSVKSSAKDSKPIEEALRMKSLKKVMRKIGKDASNKIYGVVQFYYNSKGELDYKHVPPEQIVYIPNALDEDVIDAVIRYYEKDVIIGGNEKTITVAEFWDDKYVWYFYKEEDSDKYILAPEDMYEVNPTYNKYTVLESLTDVKVEPSPWGRPPFAILKNNDELQRDIDPVLPLIKVYDIVMSDFSNNLEDFQDVYWVLKGYGGQDLDDFLDEVKRYKTIKTDEDGDAKAETIEIPVEAREKLLDRIEKAIFKFGRGVNVEDLEGDITNVRIYSMYSGLDLKANDFESELSDFFDQVLYFVSQSTQVVNAADIELSFKRSMILNKKEIVETLISQVGFLSKKTLLELHPDITDVEEELKRVEEDEAKLAKQLGGDLDFSSDKDKEKTKGGE